MTISVAQQAAALAQAAALGLAVGLLYDLFRVLRVRVALPLLGAVLDLSFWIIVTVALFVWSQQAWRGEIRLYGIFFLFGGGVLYFWLISTWMLKIGYFLADAAALVWRILTLPLAAAGKLQKKTKKFAKNSFHFAQEWFRINQITEELDAAARRRERRETGGSAHAVQASRSFDQGRGDGPADLHGHGPGWISMGRSRPSRWSGRS